MATFRYVEKRAPCRVAGPRAELRRGGSVLQWGLVERELITRSPGEDHQRKEQEGEATQGTCPFILNCFASIHALINPPDDHALRTLILIALRLLPD